MKLFSSPTSPFVRKVRVVAAEIGITERIELVSTNPFQSTDALIAKNPLSRIPALVTEDHGTLFDSAVIAEYLDVVHGKAALHPTGVLRWSTITLQALADGIMDAAVLLRLEQLRPDEQRSKDVAARQSAVIDRGLDRLCQSLDRLEAKLTIGNIAAACALGYLDLRHRALDWRDGRHALAAWHETIDRRPSMASTAHPSA